MFPANVFITKIIVDTNKKIQMFISIDFSSIMLHVKGYLLPTHQLYFINVKPCTGANTEPLPFSHI